MHGLTSVYGRVSHAYWEWAKPTCKEGYHPTEQSLITLDDEARVSSRIWCGCGCCSTVERCGTTYTQGVGWIERWTAPYPPVAEMVAVGNPYSLNAIIVSDIFYRIVFDYWFLLALVLATQLTGFTSQSHHLHPQHATYSKRYKQPNSVVKLY